MKIKSVNTVLAVVALAAVLGLSACARTEVKPGLAWLKQSGAVGGDDTGSAVYARGDAYVAGFTTGTLAGQQKAGFHDALLMAYDRDGKEVWQRQFGTGQDTYARGAFADGSSVYLAGNTTGAFPGYTGGGNIDAFVCKLDSSGNQAWVRQFGGPENDYAHAVCSIGGYLYVAGYTFGDLPGQSSRGSSDVFLTKLDASGQEVWTRQFGTELNEYAYALCADASGVYLAGITYGNVAPLCGLGGSDAFVRKYDFQGNEVWTQQWGTEVNDYANAVAVGEDGIYVLGITYGGLEGASRGGADAFLSKLGADGGLEWTRQFGTDATDFAWGAAVHDGKAFVTGYTAGTFPGQVNAGAYDAYAAAFNGAGDILWLTQFGTERDDYAKGVSAGEDGIYFSGSTRGSFSARQGNDADIWVAKLS